MSAMASFCHTFGAAFSAWAFYQAKKAEIESLMQNCGYYCYKWDPYTVRAPKGIPDPDSPFGECEELPGDPNSPNQGETYNAKQGSGPPGAKPGGWADGHGPS
jgi:hypothetical protein